MVVKSFYLLGESQSTAQDIDLPDQLDAEDLRHIIASHFAIVEPKGTPDHAAKIVRLVLLTKILRNWIHLRKPSSDSYR